MALVRITQERSKIRCIERHKRTLQALGLRRINHSVVHEDTPQIRGMVNLVRYLVRMEPATEGEIRGEATPAVSPKRKPARRVGAKKGSGLKAASKRKTKGRVRTSREASRARKKRATRS